MQQVHVVKTAANSNEGPEIEVNHYNSFSKSLIVFYVS